MNTTSHDADQLDWRRALGIAFVLARATGRRVRVFRDPATGWELAPAVTK